MAKQSAKQKQQARSRHAASVKAASVLAAGVEHDALEPVEADPDASWEPAELPAETSAEAEEEHAPFSHEERSQRWNVRVVDEEGAFYAFFLDESCAKKWLRRNPRYRLAVGEEGRAPRRVHEVVEETETSGEAGSEAGFPEAAAEDQELVSAS